MIRNDSLTPGQWALSFGFLNLAVFKGIQVNETEKLSLAKTRRGLGGPDEIQWQEHELGSYPTIALTWEDGCARQQPKKRPSKSKIGKQQKSTGYLVIISYTC